MRRLRLLFHSSVPEKAQHNCLTPKKACPRLRELGADGSRNLHAAQGFLAITLQRIVKKCLMQQEEKEGDPFCLPRLSIPFKASMSSVRSRVSRTPPTGRLTQLTAELFGLLSRDIYWKTILLAAFVSLSLLFGLYIGRSIQTMILHLCVKGNPVG